MVGQLEELQWMTCKWASRSAHSRGEEDELRVEEQVNERWRAAGEVGRAVDELQRGVGRVGGRVALNEWKEVGRAGGRAAAGKWTSRRTSSTERVEGGWTSR